MQTKEASSKCNWKYNLKDEGKRILKAIGLPLHPNSIQKIFNHNFVFNYVILDNDPPDHVISKIINSDWENTVFAGTIRGKITGTTNTTYDGLLIEVSPRFLYNKVILGIRLNKEGIWQVKLDRNKHSSHIYYCGQFELT